MWRIKRTDELNDNELERDIASDIWGLRSIIQLLLNLGSFKIVIQLLWMNLWKL